jgi:hypothetical protein
MAYLVSITSRAERDLAIPIYQNCGRDTANGETMRNLFIGSTRELNENPERHL